MPISDAARAAIERGLRSLVGGAISRQAAAFVESVLGKSSSNTRRQQEEFAEALAGAGLAVSPQGLVEPMDRPRRVFGEPANLEDVTVQRIGARPANREGEPPLPGEESPFGSEVLTPASSNVFSFSYDQQTQTLYVTFQAHVVHPDAVTRGKGRKGGNNQLRGKTGRTVGQKTGERGSMYAYLRVPPGVFENMKAAASKGKFVWDHLRIRGTIYGHQYAYQLVQGQVSPGVGGVYIPRKVTPEGFRVRSVADLGTGRRGYQSSTLSGQRFRTRRP